MHFGRENFDHVEALVPLEFGNTKISGGNSVQTLWEWVYFFRAVQGDKKEI